MALRLLPLFSAVLVVLFVGLFNQQSRKNEEIYHYADYQKEEFYKNFLQQINQKENKLTKTKGLISPHHLFASSLMAEIFSKAKNKDIKTVILVSPNHFEAGHNILITSEAFFKTNFGDVLPDKKVIQKLTQNDEVGVEEAPFKEEHGIYNLMPFIKKAFPRAKVVPIIIKARTNKEVSKKLAEKLAEIEDAIFVASIDFSHYKSAKIAEECDRKSIEAISNFDLEKIYSLDLDSPSTLYTLLYYLKITGASKFELINNTNSGYLTGQIDLAETTSYITGYFE